MALPFDFNGDRYADLAIGTPYAADRAGAVNVLYGSEAGLSLEGNQLWSQDSAGILGESETGDRFGSAIASSDFNRDGYADLAIGAPNDGYGDTSGGGVHVLYGTTIGLAATGNQMWTEGSLSATTLGSALAAGDFNADGYRDLAIGAPLGDKVVVLHGAPSGLTDTAPTTLTPEQVGMTSDPSDVNYIGTSLVAGDIDGDGRDDLVVGLSTEYGGAVALFNGGANGLANVASGIWSQESPGVPGEGLAGDRFGHALAIGDFNADGLGDLAVGSPDEEGDSFCSVQNPEPSLDCTKGGVVHILHGSAQGLSTDENQRWSQASPGIPGGGQELDRFGSALAAGDFDGDGWDDLAIGAPGEDPTVSRSLKAFGAVTVLYGAASGLSARDAVRWTQDSAGIPGTAEPTDSFGMSLASGDYDHSGHDDLAIGAPGEKVTGRNRDGEVDVMFGMPSGLSGVNAQAWSIATPGFSAFADWFGMVLGTTTGSP